MLQWPAIVRMNIVTVYIKQEHNTTMHMYGKLVTLALHQLEVFKRSFSYHITKAFNQIYLCVYFAFYPHFQELSTSLYKPLPLVKCKCKCKIYLLILVYKLYYIYFTFKFYCYIIYLCLCVFFFCSLARAAVAAPVRSTCV